MASSATTSASAQKSRRREQTAAQFIDDKLRRTRAQVRFVDLTSGIMTLAAAVLMYLLAFAIIDHWIVPLSTVARWLACLLFLAASTAFVVFTILPGLFHKINPLYAARAIEEGTPTLKNSVINFLQLRGKRSTVHQQVLRAVEARAANDLAAIPPDVTVDRSRLIHVGYFLSAVLALFAIYKIASPKDPFQSAARVLLPWADIQRPTRVEILEVLPGDVLTFYGETVEVSAAIRGAADAVRLHLSSLDKQIVDQTIVLNGDGAGSPYTGRLPADPSGVQQDLIYWIEAGDAKSSEFRVEVATAPLIRVDRLQYEYPPYTRLEPRTSQGAGEIEAVAGTRVTVHGEANHPLRSASLHLLSEPSASDAARAELASREKSVTLPMQTSGQRAEREFQLRDDASRAPQRAYELRCVTAEGHPSSRALRYPIRVLPDYPPEVEILSPTVTQFELPVNQRQVFELRALDPDFGLRRIIFEASSPAINPLRRTLFSDDGGVLGQQVAQTAITPSELGLEPGDRLTVVAVAEDNRHNADGELASQRTRSHRCEILIVAASASGRSVPDDGGSSSEASAEPDEVGGDEVCESQSAGEGQAGGEGQSAGEGQASGSEQGEGGEDAGAGENAAGEQSAAEASEGDSADSESTASSGGGQGGDENQASQENQQPEGAQGQTAGATSSGESSASDSGRSPPQSSGSSEADSSPNGESAGASEGGQQPGRATDAGDRRSTDSQNDVEDPEPLHDGEVFERALEHLQQQRGRENGAATEAQRPRGRDPADPQAKSNSAAESQKPGETEAPPNGEQSSSTEAASDQASTGQTPQADEGSRGEEPESGASPQDRQSTAGAGQEAEESGGAGMSDTTPRDRSKSDAEPGESEKMSEPSALPDDERQTDSEGGSSGDHSGGGQEGGGQNAAQPGTDNAGSQTPSDRGAGAAEEMGQGETANVAGEDQEAARPTGASGEKPGEGSSSQPGTERIGGQPQPGSEPSDASSSPAETPGRQGKPGNQGASETRGSGLPGEAAPRQADSTPDPADAANLEYSKRATNLVLEYLEEQSNDPDEALLDKLGWTPDELRAFLDRWAELKQKAAEEQGRSELDEKLRSLGLRPQVSRTREGGRIPDQRLDGLNEAGSRSVPPSRYRELFDAFRRGRSRVQQP